MPSPSQEYKDSVQILRQWCDYFIDQGLAFPEVVTAQMVHETDFLSSKIYKENNNLFGMKKNKRGYCVGERNGHALYVNTLMSVKDYKAYQNRMLFYAAKQNRYPHTNEEYMALLRDLPQFGCGKGVCYAEDPNYLNSLRKRIEMLKSM